MQPIYPKKLKPGDEIRVIAPSRSMAIITEESKSIANKRFKELGLKVSFGKHIYEIDDFNSSSVASRLDDLHAAFADPNVKGILTVIGGFNSNQLLQEIDWELIRGNPKVFCGFSDITVLNNSILAKAGLVTYSGAHYSTFGMKLYFEYVLQYFKNCLMSNEPFEVVPSKEWTDDPWFLNQDERKPIKNEGWWEINKGHASGSIRGGNLCTFNLLQGTEFMPSLQESVLFLEDDSESLPHDFDRDLVSLIQQPSFDSVKAIVIGRFQIGSKMSRELLTEIIRTKKELAHIPIIANVDFGHSNQLITYPVGGEVELTVSRDKSWIKIINH